MGKVFCVYMDSHGHEVLLDFVLLAFTYEGERSVLSLTVFSFYRRGAGIRAILRSEDTVAKQ